MCGCLGAWWFSSYAAAALKLNYRIMLMFQHGSRTSPAAVHLPALPQLRRVRLCCGATHTRTAPSCGYASTALPSWADGRLRRAAWQRAAGKVARINNGNSHWRSWSARLDFTGMWVGMLLSLPRPRSSTFSPTLNELVHKLFRPTSVPTTLW